MQHQALAVRYDGSDGNGLVRQYGQIRGQQASVADDKGCFLKVAKPVEKLMDSLGPGDDAGPS